MTPGSSVCGLYFSHPQARYFGVGRIGTDQLEDYAARKGWSSTRRAAGWRQYSTTPRAPQNCG